jgi:hypothetical protein
MENVFVVGYNNSKRDEGIIHEATSENPFFYI